MERESDAARRLLEQSQLALLERASDDDEGLNLRANGKKFEMNEGKMTPDERHAYKSPWSKILHSMALKLAAVLERVRDMTRKVRAREQAADNRIAEAEQRERDAATDRKELDDQKASLVSKSEAVERRQATIAASERESKLWSVVTQMLVTSPDKFEISSDGSIRLLEAEKSEAEPAFVAFLKNEPPEWVKTVARKQGQLAATLADLREKETQADKKIVELSNLVARVGPILTHQQMASVAVARKVIREHRKPSQDLER